MALLILWCWPLLHSKHAALPVLLIEQIGTPHSLQAHTPAGISIDKFEKLLKILHKKQFTSVLPADILGNKLPPRPVLLVLSGGYQIYYTHILPLLEKYQFSAAIALPVAYIGQYDSWHTKGPWQNLLTPQHISEMKKIKNIAFISQGLDARLQQAPTDDLAIWQVQESATRLRNLYKISPQAILLPPQASTRPAVQKAAQETYSLQIMARSGNNPLPLQTTCLSIYPLTQGTSFIRLIWRLQRN